MIRRLAILLLLLAIPVVAEDKLRATAEAVSAAIAEDPSGAKELFSEEFLQHVPWDKVAPLMKSLHAGHGKVAKVEEVKRDSDQAGSFRFVFQKGGTMPVRLGIQGDPPRIVALWFGPVSVADDTWEKVDASLKALPGRSSLCAVDLSADPASKPLADLSSQEPLAIGSAFKLYILGALIEEVKAGRMHWEDVVRLRKEWKSLPSGFLQQWPVEAPVTLHTLASLMISQSDNTATDHLLYHLGRERVEAMLEPMGNSAPERNRPFLSTSEMFLVKAAPDTSLRDRWPKLEERARREALSSLSRADLEKCIWSEPRLIDSLEWFASTRDLCAAMGWLAKNADDTAKGILSINRGLSIDWSAWTYVGFKGGSEPGLISTTWLLQRRDGRWFALSLTWNDPQHPLDEGAFLVLAGRAIDLVGGTK